jgi:hypothetical protein
MEIEKLTVQSRYTRAPWWGRAPKNVRFSDYLIRQMRQSSASTHLPQPVASGEQSAYPIDPHSRNQARRTPPR